MKLRYMGKEIPKVITKRLNGVVTNFTFNPDAEVPDDYANALMKSYPGIYEKASGKVDMSKYTIKKDYVDKTMNELRAKLTDEQNAFLYDLAKGLSEGKEYDIKEKKAEKKDEKKPDNPQS